MSTCGECFFSRPMPNDLKRRVCFGTPPQGIALPAKNGINIQFFRPIVGATDPSCWHFRLRMVVSEPVLPGEVVLDKAANS